MREETKRFFDLRRWLWEVFWFALPVLLFLVIYAVCIAKLEDLVTGVKSFLNGAPIFLVALLVRAIQLALNPYWNSICELEANIRKLDSFTRDRERKTKRKKKDDKDKPVPAVETPSQEIHQRLQAYERINAQLRQDNDRVQRQYEEALARGRELDRENQRLVQVNAELVRTLASANIRFDESDRVITGLQNERDEIRSLVEILAEIWQGYLSSAFDKIAELTSCNTQLGQENDQLQQQVVELQRKYDIFASLFEECYPLIVGLVRDTGGFQHQVEQIAQMVDLEGEFGKGLEGLINELGALRNRAVIAYRLVTIHIENPESVTAEGWRLLQKYLSRYGQADTVIDDRPLALLENWRDLVAKREEAEAPYDEGSLVDPVLMALDTIRNLIGDPVTTVC